MDPLSATMIAGGGSLASGILGYMGTEQTNATNTANVDATNATQIALSQSNQQFQADMSNTAYQRQMADMTKAGLNPMLAMDKGGASTPSGNVAQVQAPQIQNPMTPLVNGLQLGISNAMDAAKLSSQLKNQDADTDLKVAQTAVSTAQKGLTVANTQGATNYANLTAQQIQALQNQQGAISAKANFDTMKSNMDSKYYGLDSLTRRAQNTLNVGNSAMSLLGGPLKSIVRSGGAPEAPGYQNNSTPMPGYLDSQLDNAGSAGMYYGP